MKKWVIFLLTGLFIWMSSLMAQDVPEKVIGAFKEGSAQELNKYLGDKVDLNILNKQNCVDKQGAKETMAAFFSDHKVCGFTVNHYGKREDSGFIIGTLATADGNFRVHCFFRKEQNSYVIHQIRIDNANE
ncbi:uncharacterized protein DUF4783 [Bacteroides zoogleoformans]|uniref:DUF4783 domain-containing protein n=1 Tax=Bacteroides zoogleoformans TaxID=28119 RepID=A0ABN5IPF5_9BACE|nr:DUF4783 domain-containing protein [Bacteroides zoogleoformans]AVM53796.1 DUF4783 domain-containing protein [Bacteroides zoogleoformans]TWJ18216.1 uncharacterized protein DUF4783 [Bacteroides zoogleoformans]